ncbi:MAG: hypothetical protein ACOYU0_07635 [Nitrospirota bacterium]
MIWLRIFLILILLPSLSFSESENLVLNGIPIVQCTSSVENSLHFPLTESQQSEARVLITEKGGAGYIRVVRSGEKVLYMEHMGLILETITYAKKQSNRKRCEKDKISTKEIRGE